MTDDLPDWEDPVLHHEATEATVWIKGMLVVAHLDEAVFERRVGYPAEMRKLIEKLILTAHLHPLSTPDVIYTCQERLDDQDARKQNRWLSAMARAWYRPLTHPDRREDES